MRRESVTGRGKASAKRTVGRSASMWQAAWAGREEASQALWPSDHREGDEIQSTKRSLEGVEVKDG